MEEIPQVQFLDKSFRSSGQCTDKVVDVLGVASEAFGRISCAFCVNANPDPEVDSPGAVRT